MEIKDINLDDYEILEQSDEKIILKKKFKYPRWEDLETINGVYIERNSSIISVSDARPVHDNRDIFIDEKHVKSAMAMAQISQLMPYYGGEITDEEWKDGRILKYVIIKIGNHVSCDDYNLKYEFLAFHTKEQRDEFLKNNEQLVEDYLMIE